ncbi:MAG: phosphoribosylanthranilate isomerase [Cytophagaceae bacterium]|nr:phosphoribosylanthranilate isomerase [Cytophagaceae bacterium]
MKIKVCGMKYGPNIKEVSALKPDYMGFIFYSSSKRFVGNDLNEQQLKELNGIEKVGVFVNASVSEVLTTAKKFGFKTVQLHGDETPEYCKEIKSAGLKIIKAIQINDEFDFNTLKEYEQFCDFFLFDTKSEGYGGTGKKFNWEVLKKYNNKVPFFLSGGIDLEDIEEIKKMKGLNIHAIDINSKFEIKPGEKDYKKIQTFIETMNNA